ncbi:ROK family glucokinase [Saxibacter everestensis]|uniref:Glucokinase n=1 Tax=Saxibacter everestensis TaxID=2909229 RepID=A0ABY8QYR7_9MICO|nr:ROK family glucokinase [Brevibacteriaceae bacterium ZFBP1038]
MRTISSEQLGLGVDIGGTKIATGLVDPAGTLLKSSRKPTPADDPKALLEVLIAEIRAFADEYPVESVGIAAAGFVNAARSTVMFAPNIAWRDENLKEPVEQATGLPVVVENDANAAGWAEFQFGGGRDAEDLVLLTLGTGLGGAIIAEGELLRGGFGMAAELGHLRLVPNGILCGCGNRGCWEKYTSGSALTASAQQLAAANSPEAERFRAAIGAEGDDITGELVSKAAAQGNREAAELLAGLGEWLGVGIAQLAAVLDPSLVVIGGGLSEVGELLLKPARDALREHLPARAKRPELALSVATLGGDAGMIGAADLGLLASRGSGVGRGAGSSAG